MIVPESTKIKQKNGMIKDFGEGIPGKRLGPIIQLQTKTLCKEA